MEFFFEKSEFQNKIQNFVESLVKKTVYPTLTKELEDLIEKKIESVRMDTVVKTPEEILNASTNEKLEATEINVRLD